MDRNNFIDILKRDDPREIIRFLEKNSKRKKLNPIIEFEEIPPDNSIDMDIDNKKHKIITATADDIKVI